MVLQIGKFSECFKPLSGLISEEFLEYCEYPARVDVVVHAGIELKYPSAVFKMVATFDETDPRASGWSFFSSDT